MPTSPRRACTAGRAATGSCCRSCCAPAAGALRAINRWKMVDNLRRSLVAPASLALLAFALATGGVSPWASLAARRLRVLRRPADGRARRPGAEPRRHRPAPLLSPGARRPGRALPSGAWLLAQLLQLALMAADAIVRALYRRSSAGATCSSGPPRRRRRRRRRPTSRSLVRKHWGAPVAAALLLARAAGRAARAYPRWRRRCSARVWALSPVWTWWVSRPRPRAARRRALGRRPRLPRTTSAATPGACSSARRRRGPPPAARQPADRRRATWSRTAPRRPTSACTCWRRRARSASAGSARVEHDRARSRRRWRRWRRCRATAATSSTGTTPSRPQALLPQYVSTVDSGNLCTPPARARAGLPGARPRAARRQRRCGARWRPRRRAIAAAARRRHRAARRRARSPTLLADADAARADRAPTRRASTALLDAAAAELRGDARRRPSTRRRRARRTASPGRSRTTWRRCARPARPSPAAATRRALRRAAARASPRPASALAGEPDFSFLFNRKRRLFHIGFRVAEHQLDGGFYDLLASEARATSLLGDRQGRRAGRALGRARPAVLRRRRARRPALVVGIDVRVPDADAGARRAARQRPAQRGAARRCASRSPSRASTTCRGASRSRRTRRATTRSPTSTRRRACRAWRCAARRTTSWSIAPYATALAAQVAPHRAAANLRRLEQARARGRYGFIEALDYSPGAPVGRRGRRAGRAPSWRTTRA